MLILLNCDSDMAYFIQVKSHTKVEGLNELHNAVYRLWSGGWGGGQKSMIGGIMCRWACRLQARHDEIIKCKFQLERSLYVAGTLATSGC